MKKIHKWGLAAASGILTILGFGSCTTTKYVDMSQKISEKELEIQHYQAENANLRGEHAQLQKQIEQLKIPATVYGPPRR